MPLEALRLTFYAVALTCVWLFGSAVAEVLAAQRRSVL